MIDPEGTDNWIEYRPKQYLTKQTAMELILAQEKTIFDLEDRLQRALNQCDALDIELGRCRTQLVQMEAKGTC